MPARRFCVLVLQLVTLALCVNAVDHLIYLPEHPFDESEPLDYIASKLEPQIVPGCSDDSDADGLYDDINDALQDLFHHYDTESSSAILYDMFDLGYFNQEITPQVTLQLVQWIHSQLRHPVCNLNRAEYCAALIFMLPLSAADHIPALLAALMRIPNWDTVWRIRLYIRGTVQYEAFTSVRDTDMLRACCDTIVARFRSLVVPDPELISLWHLLLSRCDKASAARSALEQFGKVSFAYGARLFHSLVDRDASRDEIRAMLAQFGALADDDQVEDLYMELRLFGADADMKKVAGFIRRHYCSDLCILDDGTPFDDVWCSVRETLPRILSHVLPYQYDSFIYEFYKQYMLEVDAINRTHDVTAHRLYDHQGKRWIHVLFEVHSYFTERLLGYHYDYLPQFIQICFDHPINDTDVTRFMCVVLYWFMEHKPDYLPLGQVRVSCIENGIAELLRVIAEPRSPLTFRRNMFQIAAWAATFVSPFAHRSIKLRYDATLPMMVVRHPLWPQNPKRDLLQLSTMILALPPDLHNVVDAKDNLITLLLRHPAFADDADPKQSIQGPDLDSLLGFLYGIISEEARSWTCRAVPDHIHLLQSKRNVFLSSLTDQLETSLLRVWKSCAICKKFNIRNIKTMYRLIYSGYYHVQYDGRLIHDCCRASTSSS